MTVLTRKDLEEGLRIANLRSPDKKDPELCSCGRSKRRCTVTQRISPSLEKTKKEEHQDLTYEAIERRYQDWILLHGYLLIEHGLNTIH